MGVPNGSSSNGHVSSRAAKHNIPSHFIGGNHLDAAPPSSVKDFVASHEGHSVISSVSSTLVAPDELWSSFFLFFFIGAAEFANQWNLGSD